MDWEKYTMIYMEETTMEDSGKISGKVKIMPERCARHENQVREDGKILVSGEYICIVCGRYAPEGSWFCPMCRKRADPSDQEWELPF